MQVKIDNAEGNKPVIRQAPAATRVIRFRIPEQQEINNVA